jgi:hypothetical protein
MATTTDGPALVAGWVTSQEVADRMGITPSAFRSAVQRSPEMKAAQQMLGPLACFPTHVVEDWLASRPGRGRVARDPVAARHQAEASMAKVVAR